MKTTILDGKALALKLLSGLKSQVNQIKLAVIQVGDDPASSMYVKLKIKRSHEIGIETSLLKFDESVTQTKLLDVISSLNSDPSVSGFFIQAPIPKQLDLGQLCAHIDPFKDVDGMNPINLGKLFAGDSTAFAAATALSVMELIKSIPNYQLEGKHAVIINRSTILGKPLAALLLQQNVTVTICHSKTQKLQQICKNADILISATGRPNFVGADFVKEGAVLIDCGAPDPEINFESVNGIAGFVSPVPGGVGPLTIACLLKNCVLAQKRQ